MAHLISAMKRARIWAIIKSQGYQREERSRKGEWQVQKPWGKTCLAHIGQWAGMEKLKEQFTEKMKRWKDGKIADDQAQQHLLLGHDKDLGFYTGEVGSLRWTKLHSWQIWNQNTDLLTWYFSILYLRPHNFQWQVLFFTTKPLRVEETGGWIDWVLGFHILFIYLFIF